MKTFIILAIFLLVSRCNGQCNIDYTAQDGDTCDSIASENNLSTDDFTSLNPGLDCTNLQSGQQVCVLGTSSGSTSSGATEEEAQPVEEEEQQTQAVEEVEETQSAEEESQPNTGTEEESQPSTGTEEESQPSSGTEEETQPSTGTEEESHVEGPFDSVEVDIPPVKEGGEEEWPVEEWVLEANENEVAPTTGVDLFAEEVIYAHQVYRAKYDLPPLTYSYELANEATEWAKYLAENNLFEHDTGTDSQGRVYGESLAASYYGPKNPAFYIDQWGAEEQYFIPGCIFPDCSTTGEWYNVGHYTQIIWRNTQSVGCGYWTVKTTAISTGSNTVFVCRYSPAGNYTEQKVY